MADPKPFTWTDAEGNAWALVALNAVEHHSATLDEIRSVLTAQGYAIVRVVGTEPTAEELRALWIRHDSEPFAAQRALYLAGSASREPEIERLRESVAKLEGDVVFQRHQREIAEECASEQTKGFTNAVQTITELKERATTAEARVKDLEDLAYIGRHHFPDLTWKARCEELRVSLRTAEAELARVRAELDRLTTSLGGADEHKTKFEAIRERDEARAKLAECERDLVDVMRSRDRIVTQLESHRAVVEEAGYYVEAVEKDYRIEGGSKAYVTPSFQRLRDALSASEPSSSFIPSSEIINEASEPTGKAER